MGPACTEHRDLLATISEGNPSDAELTRYAEEVPECAACRRELSVALQVHPSVLTQGGTADAAEEWRTQGEGDAAMARLFTELRARRSWRVWPVAVVAAAVGLIILQGLWVAELTPSPTVEEEPVASVPLELTQPVPVPVPVRVPDEAPPVIDPAPVNNDAVAIVDEPPVETADWEPPAFEDLRTGTVKAVAPTVRSAELRLSENAPSVGSVVALTVSTSAGTALSACVSGPETGVIWRGSVDPGRSVLTRGDKPIGFAFSEPGTYRFTLSLADSCTDPVHTVEVEVD